ncbi:MAG: helix-turn-helix domain-containing protein [Pseudomonadota bacterium]
MARSTPLKNRRWLTVREIVELLPVKERTVLRELQKGRLKGFKFGKRWLVAEEDLLEYMERSGDEAVGQAASA